MRRVAVGRIDYTRHVEDGPRRRRQEADLEETKYELLIEKEGIFPDEINDYNDQDEADGIWYLNYKEASIFLEEGLNNDKFTRHPRNTNALKSYYYVHNHWFYMLDAMAAIFLLVLTIFEKPGVKNLELPSTIHAILELIALCVVSIDCWLKLKWMGFRALMTHQRTVIKVVSLTAMIIEALVVIIRNDSHFRILRCLRPVFLIDGHYFEGVRRALRQLLKTLPAIFDIILLLFFIITFFALLGFSLFSSDPQNSYFSTFSKSFMSLFISITNNKVLLSVINSMPDVMLPAYYTSRWSSIFFILYTIIQLYFMLNMLLAVAYDAYSRGAKKKFHQLLIHRRMACELAFNMLVSVDNKRMITFKNFRGVMKILKPGSSDLKSYLIYKALDKDKKGFLSLEDFYSIYDVIELKWQLIQPETKWYSKWFSNHFLVNLCEYMNNLVRDEIFERVIDGIICGSLIWEIFQASSLTKNMRLYSVVWVKTMFIGLYISELVVKFIGYGPVEFVVDTWNLFDVTVTLVAIFGHLVRPFGLEFGFFYILRSFRLIKFFEKTKRYKEIMGSFLFIVIRELRQVTLILFVILYFFAILGMEFFSAADTANPAPVNRTQISDYYPLNNFSNIFNSFVTLFVLMFGYTWFFLMDRYANLVGEWSRFFFMTFYILALIVLTIVLACILEAFVFKMHCRRQFEHDEDEDETLEVRDVILTGEEHQAVDLSCDHPPGIGSILFRGQRIRTKFSFSLRMYSDEVRKWIQDYESEGGISRLMIRGRGPTL